MDRCLQVAWFNGMQAIAEQTNFIFSPLSLRASLALLAAGARGATLSQLLDFLGSEHSADLAAATAVLHDRVDSWPQVAFAAGIFVDRALHLTPEFELSVSYRHSAVARSVDFTARPAAAAAEVNGFIERATAGRICNLVLQDGVDGDAKVVLASGMHFKATWARRFDPEDTVTDTFHLADGYSSVHVPFLSDAGMQYAESFDGPGLGFKVLQCFYKMTNHDGRLDRHAPCFCMLVFLPHDKDGLAGLLRLAVTEPDFVMRCVPRREQEVCPCMIPKFRFRFEFDATDALSDLGLTSPFDRKAADLSGTVVNPPPEGLYASAMGLACAVEVDEEGTTAVAAVGIMYEPTSPTYSEPPPPMSFVADHPFMFAIIEYVKGDVLFLGHVMDPSLES